MTDQIRNLLQQIHQMEDELRGLLSEKGAEVQYRMEGKRIEFEQRVHETHQHLKVELFRWLRASRPKSILAAPFIYSMIVPISLLDVSISIYQAICFRLCNIPRVRRADFIVVDRHHLAYLNAIEKLNCMYCGYSNGVIAYVTEIAARTEQYWCPIKHAREIPHEHQRYRNFIDYGDAGDYPEKLEAFRNALNDSKSATD